MKIEALLHELEDLVTGISQCLTMLASTQAELHGAKPVLQNLLAAKGAYEQTEGPNEWRDRLVRDMVRIVALRARPAAQDDADLQSLIASVLEAPVGSFQKN